MKKFRVIYEVRCVTYTGELIFRRYARNLKTARKIAREIKDRYVEIRLCTPYEHNFIRYDCVEG